jgi:hypothetical protein
VHFLNAILSTDLGIPIATVDILNPYNDKEFIEDKLSIVDVKARDNEVKSVPDRNSVSEFLI